MGRRRCCCGTGTGTGTQEDDCQHECEPDGTDLTGDIEVTLEGWVRTACGGGYGGDDRLCGEEGAGADNLCLELNDAFILQRDNTTTLQCTGDNTCCWRWEGDVACGNVLMQFRFLYYPSIGQIDANLFIMSIPPYHQIPMEGTKDITGTPEFIDCGPEGDIDGLELFLSQSAQCISPYHLERGRNLHWPYNGGDDFCALLLDTGKATVAVV